MFWGVTQRIFKHIWTVTRGLPCSITRPHCSNFCLFAFKGQRPFLELNWRPSNKGSLFFTAYFFDYSPGLLSWELRSDVAGRCRGPYTGKHQLSSAYVLSDRHLGSPQMGSLRHWAASSLWPWTVYLTSSGSWPDNHSDDYLSFFCFLWVQKKSWIVISIHLQKRFPFPDQLARAHVSPRLACFIHSPIQICCRHRARGSVKMANASSWSLLSPAIHILPFLSSYPEPFLLGDLPV